MRECKDRVCACRARLKITRTNICGPSHLKCACGADLAWEHLGAGLGFELELQIVELPFWKIIIQGVHLGFRVESRLR